MYLIIELVTFYYYITLLDLSPKMKNAFWSIIEQNLGQLKMIRSQNILTKKKKLSTLMSVSKQYLDQLKYLTWKAEYIHFGFFC